MGRSILGSSKALCSDISSCCAWWTSRVPRIWTIVSCMQASTLHLYVHSHPRSHCYVVICAFSFSFSLWATRGSATSSCVLCICRVNLAVQETSTRQWIWPTLLSPWPLIRVLFTFLFFSPTIISLCIFLLTSLLICWFFL